MITFIKIRSWDGDAPESCVLRFGRGKPKSLIFRVWMQWKSLEGVLKAMGNPMGVASNQTTKIADEAERIDQMAKGPPHVGKWAVMVTLTILGAPVYKSEVHNM